MNGKENKARISGYVKQEIKEYIESQCDFYGMSMGAYISMVVMQSKQQGEISNSLMELSEIMKRMEKLSDNKEVE